MLRPTTHTNARMNAAMPTPPERFRPRYAPSAVKPTVTATSPITWLNTVRVWSRALAPKALPAAG